MSYMSSTVCKLWESRAVNQDLPAFLKLTFQWEYYGHYCSPISALQGISAECSKKVKKTANSHWAFRKVLFKETACELKYDTERLYTKIAE